MALFNKAEKVNTTVSLGDYIYKLWGWLGGISMLGGIFGWFSPIVDVLGKPLSVVVGATLLLLFYGAGKKLFFEKRKEFLIGFPETCWEISLVNGVRNTVKHPNIRQYWGFTEFYTLHNGLKKTYCILKFSSPLRKAIKCDIKSKNGEIILQEVLGITEVIYMDDNDGLIHGMLLIIEGNLDASNNRYVISLYES